MEDQGQTDWLGNFVIVGRQKIIIAWFKIKASLVAQMVICLQCGRPGFDPWVGKIPWRREWLSTPVFFSGGSHGQRNLEGYSPWGGKESDTIEWPTLSVSDKIRHLKRHMGVSGCSMMELADFNCIWALGKNQWHLRTVRTVAFYFLLLLLFFWLFQKLNNLHRYFFQVLWSPSNFCQHACLSYLIILTLFSAHYLMGKYSI